MRVIGLTGGIASGKSEVARRFRERGIPVIDADKVGHALIERGGAAVEPVVAAFGAEYLVEGAIDRPKLGARVFANPADLERLNAIVHPAIKAEIVQQLAQLREAGHAVAVIDAALLGESGKIADDYVGLVLVLAPRELRLKRLMDLRGLSEEQAARRIDAQTPPESKIPLANWIIHNEGTLDELVAEADALADEFLGS